MRTIGRQRCAVHRNSDATDSGGMGVALRAALLRAPLSLGPTVALRQPDCFAPSTSLTQGRFKGSDKERQLMTR